MHLYLIRHCQSENNALWVKVGSGDGRSADPALTEIGQKQAAELAHFIAGTSPTEEDRLLNRAGIPLTYLYCSLMRRSIQTATHIASAVNLPLVARDDIHERGGIYLTDPETRVNNGLPGPNREHFTATYPDLILPDSLGTSGWWNRPYEEQDAAVLRAQKMLHWLLSTHDGTGDHVGLVIHGGFIQSIFSALFQLPLLEKNFIDGREVWIKANNGSITRIDFYDQVVRLAYLNRFEFISDSLVT